MTLNQGEKILAKRLSERQREIAQIPKGTVKSRKSNVGLFQPILPDTPPPTLNIEIIIGHPLLLDVLIIIS